jgi:hypothetical protein
MRRTFYTYMENASLDEFLSNGKSEEKSEPDEGSGGESDARNGCGDGAEPRGQSSSQNNENSGDGANSRGGETVRNDTPGDQDGGDSTERRDPPTPTSRWQSNGQDCVVCERSVRRLWPDDGRLVCTDCKDWA